MTTLCSSCGKIGSHEDWCLHHHPKLDAPGGLGGFLDDHHCPKPAAPASALDTQVAGGHYKGRAIQPVEYIHANGLGFLEGCIVKRITRWRDKPAADRFEDLRKVKHEVDLLIELETKRAVR